MDVLHLSMMEVGWVKKRFLIYGTFHYGQWSGANNLVGMNARVSKVFQGGQIIILLD